MNSKNFLNIINELSNIIFFMILVFIGKNVGAGIFVCSFLIYKVLYIIFAGGLRTTLAHAIGSRRSKGMYVSSNKYFVVTLKYSVVCGAVIGFLMFALASPITKLIYGNILCDSLLKYFGIYFFIHCICEVMCGYHIGSNNGSIVFIAEIVNCILICVLCPVMIKVMSGYGEKVSNLLKAPVMVNVYNAQGAVIAMCICSVIMLLILVLGARGNFSKSRNLYSEGRNDIRFSVSAYILGSCLDSLRVKSFPYFLYFIYIALYIRGLISDNNDMLLAYGNIGSFVTHLFVVILVQNCFLGEYVGAYRNKLRSDFKKDEIKNYTFSANMLIKNSILLVLPFACSIMCFSEGISKVMFRSIIENEYKLIVIAGVCLIFNGLDRGFKAILNSSGLYNSVLFGNIVGLLVAVTYGGVISTNYLSATTLALGLIIYFALVFILHGIVVIKNVNIKFNDMLARLAICTIASIVLVILDVILARFLNMNLLILIICFLCGYATYIISLLALHGINERDIRSLKGTLLFYPLDFIGGLFGIR